MLIDISDIECCVGESLRIDAKLDLKDFEGYNVQDARISGSITNNAGRLELEAKLSCSVSEVCARCLKQISSPLVVSLNEILINSDNYSDSDGRENVTVLENKTLDLSKLAEQTIWTHAPLRLLCSEDCRGICPICGADLNVSQCGCVVNHVDPRLEKLKELLE